MKAKESLLLQKDKLEWHGFQAIKLWWKYLCLYPFNFIIFLVWNTVWWCLPFHWWRRKVELLVLKLFTIFGTGTSYPIMSHKVENNKQKTKAFFIIVSRDGMIGGFGFLRRIRKKSGLICRLWTFRLWILDFINIFKGLF